MNFNHFDSIPLEILVLDSNGIILFANKTYQTSKAMEGLVGKHFKEIITIYGIAEY